MVKIKLKEKGVTLVEVIVAISIITAILVVIGFSVTTYVEAREQLLNDTKNIYLVEEGYEIIRALRDNDWNTVRSLTVGSTQYLSVSTSSIAISGTPEVIDGQFKRSFVISNVYRNSNHDVTPSTTPGATIDNGTLEVTVSVFGPTGTSSLKALLANIHAT